MDFLTTIAFTGAALIGVFLAVCVLLAALHGASAEARPVLLAEMLRRQGNDVARLALSTGGPGFANAVRQCLDCKASARCNAWLDSGARASYDAFCPNAGYVSRMRDLATLRRLPD